jgi:hypothetical protein
MKLAGSTICGFANIIKAKDGDRRYAVENPVALIDDVQREHPEAQPYFGWRQDLLGAPNGRGRAYWTQTNASPENWGWTSTALLLFSTDGLDLSSRFFKSGE